MNLLLASASPRRAELLAQLGVDFQQTAVDIDETPVQNETAVTYVERMAREKAQIAVNRRPAGDSAQGLVILAADTTVVLGDQILGKPESFDDFSEMMRLLSGRWHQVLTAVSVVKLSEPDVLIQESILNENQVQFASLTDKNISWYWQSGEPQDKAGGYGIQGLGARFVQSIRGSYSGIVGLPLYETAEILTKFGILSTDRKN